MSKVFLHPPMHDLVRIISECAAKNPRCQKLIYERYYDYAFKIAFSYIQQYERSVEVVNDGFMKLFKAMGSFTLSKKGNIEPYFMAWLKRIIVNTAIDDLRHHKLIPSTSEISESTLDISQRQKADMNLLHKELVHYIKRLSPQYGMVFNLYEVYGLSHKEIATHLGISEGTSKSNLSKAKAHLRRSLRREPAY
jgi:RNA polymerase sigma factor (sigma-70 family)